MNAAFACLAWAASFAYHAGGTDVASRIDLTLAFVHTVMNTLLIIALNDFGSRTWRVTNGLLAASMLAWNCRIWGASESPVGESVDREAW